MQSDIREELGALRTEVERLASELAEVRAYASNLEELAHEDVLTGVHNRRGFVRDLSRAIAYRARYGTPAAVMLLDLDGFKPVNDTHGHEVGDRLLAHFAGVLRANVRASDSIGRLGGDEFALIIWQVDQAAADLKARAIEEVVGRSPMAHEGLQIKLGVSAGFALLETDDTPDSALARADRAMYARKTERKAGR